MRAWRKVLFSLSFASGTLALIAFCNGQFSQASLVTSTQDDDSQVLHPSDFIKMQSAAPEPNFEPLVNNAMSDPDHRISKDFEVPRALRSRVKFWLKIYGQYSSRQIVIMDITHPELVYDVLDFRDLAATSRSEAAYEIVSRGKTALALEAYREAFRSLAVNPHPRRLSHEQRNILRALARIRHHHPYSEYAKNIRAQTGQRDAVARGLLSAEPLFARMERIFSQMGLPGELTRLSLVESSLDVNATSKAGAVGIWQFIPESGREYLMIDDKREIDERLSPVKSTLAAAKLLKRNYFVFKNWPLAVTAYNHGLRGLPFRVKNTAEIYKLFDADSKGLGFAGRNYYSEFLAMVHAVAYRDEFFSDTPVGPAAAEAIILRPITRSETPSAIALKFGVSLNALRKLNPDIENLRKRLPKGFLVALPAFQQDDLSDLGVSMAQRH